MTIESDTEMSSDPSSGLRSEPILHDTETVMAEKFEHEPPADKEQLLGSEQEGSRVGYLSEPEGVQLETERGNSTAGRESLDDHDAENANIEDQGGKQEGRREECAAALLGRPR